MNIILVSFFLRLSLYKVHYFTILLGISLEKKLMENKKMCFHLITILSKQTFVQPHNANVRPLAGQQNNTKQITDVCFSEQKKFAEKSHIYVKFKTILYNIIICSH